MKLFMWLILFDGWPKRHRSYLQMCLWMEILSREKQHLFIYFWQPYECVPGLSKVFWVVVSRHVCYSVYFSIFEKNSKVNQYVGLLWLVVGHCESFWVLVPTYNKDGGHSVAVRIDRWPIRWSGKTLLQGQTVGSKQRIWFVGSRLHFQDK